MKQTHHLDNSGKNTGAKKTKEVGKAYQLSKQEKRIEGEGT